MNVSGGVLSTMTNQQKEAQKQILNNNIKNKQGRHLEGIVQDPQQYGPIPGALLVLEYRP
jgi:hypothetical protein